MDIATLAGIVAGLSFIVIGINLSGSIGNFFDIPAIMITFGGTMAAAFITYPIKQVLSIFRVSKKLFTDHDENPLAIITHITNLANVARKEGLLALEEAAYEIDDTFLQKGILLIVDGTDPELVRNILETELAFIEDRHKQGQGIFQALGSYAPAFGMIGTLIGLVNMLRSLDEPSTLGPSMSVALVTTFYGSLLANLLFLPMAGKLKIKSGREILLKEIMVEGILSIQAGENPRIIEEKLKVFLPPEYRASSEKASGEGDEIEQTN